jgi:hypothetical protein
MNTIAIALSDERLLKLQQVANDLNVSIEELVLIGIENLLAQKEVSSQNTTQNILNKKAGISPSLKLLQKFCIVQSKSSSDSWAIFIKALKVPTFKS